MTPAERDALRADLAEARRLAALALDWPMPAEAREQVAAFLARTEET